MSAPEPEPTWTTLPTRSRAVIRRTGHGCGSLPASGDLDLPFESFPIPADPSQSLLTYTTEPGSPSHDALSLLASWATSPAHDSDASTHDNDQQAPRQDRGYDSRSGFASRPNEA